MNNVTPPTNPVLPDSFKAAKKEIIANPAEQSPYLRAILSENRASGAAKVLSIANSSMSAALRYIASSSKQTVPGKLITPAW